MYDVFSRRLTTQPSTPNPRRLTAKWEVGDYLVTRIHGSTTRVVFAQGLDNGAGLVIRQAARDVAYEVSEGILPRHPHPRDRRILPG